MLNDLFLKQQGNKLYVEDVFSTYLYSGNNSAQTIANGIDLSGKGGMVWVKSRSLGAYHSIFDTNRGVGKWVQSDTDGGQFTDTATLSTFNSSGFSLGTNFYVNGSGYDFASWTFRKAQKFFDVVAYTGNGTSVRTLTHALGMSPGAVLIKRTDTNANWCAWHRGLSSPNTQYMRFNTNDLAVATAFCTSPAATSINVNHLPGSGLDTNTNGATYIAYFFAHDATTDGIIQCGSFTTDASGVATVSLGWEPQWLLAKSADGASNWWVSDVTRGMPVGGNRTAYLSANTSNIESLSQFYGVTNDGFTAAAQNASERYVYIAIRRPMKPPANGTSVFMPSVSLSATYPANTDYATTGFPVDLTIEANRVGSSATYVTPRLTARSHVSSSTAAEITTTGYSFASNTGVQRTFGFDASNVTNWSFRRATGFFDVVCYAGTGGASAKAHGLGVTPELIITKKRSASLSWIVYAQALGNTNAVYLNSTSAVQLDFSWANTSPTATAFTVSDAGGSNDTGATYVAYLFASCPGVSKVGTYTGNNSSQTIDCGFSNGARFVMIKRTDSTGDWYVWDTARGIVTANDPHSSLNTAVAEVTTDDSIDPAASGFIVNQVSATNVNVNGATYIYLAIA